MVPGVPLGPRRPLRRLLRVERRPGALLRRADHLRGHRGVQLDVRPRAPAVLLAPVLQPPTGPELREPVRARGHEGRRQVLVADGHRRVPAGRGALPVRGGGHQLREPPPDPRLPGRAARHGRRGVPRADPARRGQPVARGRHRVLRHGRGARVPHVLPLPGDAPDLLRDPRPEGRRDHRHPRRHPAGTGRRAVGHLPAQPRRAHPRDGVHRGTRGDVRLVRARPTDARQHRDPPPAGPAAGQLARGDRARARAAAVPARQPVPVLRRRDRDGRQHLAAGPRRGAHADAVDPGPQRRVLHHVRPRQALPPGGPVAGPHLHGGQRRVPAGTEHLAAALGARHARDPAAAPGVRRRSVRARADRQRRRDRVLPRRRHRDGAVHREPGRHGTRGHADDARPRGGGAGRRVRRCDVRADRRGRAR